MVSAMEVADHPHDYADTFIRNTMVLSWNALEGSWWFSNVCWSRPFRAS